MRGNTPEEVCTGWLAFELTRVPTGRGVCSEITRYKNLMWHSHPGRFQSESTAATLRFVSTPVWG